MPEYDPSYSPPPPTVSTSSHCSAVRSAIPSGIRVFHVPNVCHGRYSGSELTTDDHSSNLTDYAERIEKHVITSARARSSYVKTWNNQHSGHLIDQPFAYSLSFALPPPNIPAD